MSDTAKELRAKVDAIANDNTTSDVSKFINAWRLVDNAARRIEQLERGIEKANTEAVPSTEGGWFALADLDKYGEFVDGKSPRETLMQLIEELGNETAIQVHDENETLQNAKTQRRREDS